MRLREIIWKQRFAEKIEHKHGLTTTEVEEALFGRSIIRKIERGKARGEHVYVAYGQTRAGRYVVVFFVYKRSKAALPISARSMTDTERNYYEKQK